MVVRPPNFDADKRYPLLVLLHGGPQTMWSNAWGYRWNPQVFSAAGYVSLMINRPRSTGYRPEINRRNHQRLGRQSLRRRDEGIDATVAKYKYVDGSKIAAAGGSYGGYMATGSQLTPAASRPSSAMPGIYDQAAMYATGRTLFAEHDMQGTPWTAQENYKKWSPSTLRRRVGQIQKRRR